MMEAARNTARGVHLVRPQHGKSLWEEKGHRAKRQRGLCESPSHARAWKPGANGLTPPRQLPHLCTAKGRTVSTASLGCHKAQTQFLQRPDTGGFSIQARHKEND